MPRIIQKTTRRAAWCRLNRNMPTTLLWAGTSTAEWVMIWKPYTALRLMACRQPPQALQTYYTPACLRPMNTMTIKLSPNTIFQHISTARTILTWLSSTAARPTTAYTHRMPIKEEIWSARLYSTQSATISRSDTTINTRFWKATAEISREIS